MPDRARALRRRARPVRGFRAYPRAALERIAFVREAQELGFTLREVRDPAQVELAALARAVERAGYLVRSSR